MLDLYNIFLKESRKLLNENMGKEMSRTVNFYVVKVMMKKLQKNL